MSSNMFENSIIKKKKKVSISLINGTKSEEVKDVKKTQATTLDLKHKTYLSQLSNQRLQLPLLTSNLMAAKLELEKLNKKKLSPTDVSNKAFYLDQIRDLTLSINIIENNSQETKYFYDALPLLLKYYDNKGEQISERKEEKKENLLSFITVRKENNKAELYDQYLSITDPWNRTQKTIESEIQNCPDCNVEQVLNQSDGSFVCTECGNAVMILIDSNKPNYKDPILENTAFTYKRINHLNEILSQIQGKESTLIPKDDYALILAEINKSKKISENLELLTAQIMKKILKKIKLSKHYEHIQYIINKINNVSPPRFTRAEEDKIRSMFREIQEPFQKCRPKGRKNFLNYLYFIHKACELLEIDHFLPYLPLLKNPDKLRLQDNIWKKICEHLKWQFIPSYQHVKKNNTIK